MDVKKINDDQAKKEKDERIKRLDDELKFLQIKGEGLNQRSLEYFDNLQKMNQVEMEREIAALEQTEDYEKQNLQSKKSMQNNLKKLIIRNGYNLHKTYLMD